jgi:protein-tyrosine-phosphatase
MITKRVLCVCKGNGDRSPMMAAVLQMYLDNTILPDGEVHCESAGILEIAGKGGEASPLMIEAAKRIGIDLSLHKRRWVNSLNINDYDLFVCVDDEVAAYLIMELGVDIKKVCNVQVSNAWPSRFQRDLDDTAERILGVMFRVVTRYFSPE